MIIQVFIHSLHRMGVAVEFTFSLIRVRDLLRNTLDYERYFRAVRSLFVGNDCLWSR